jgi:hypothetical protein
VKKDIPKTEFYCDYCNKVKTIEGEYLFLPKNWMCIELNFYDHINTLIKKRKLDICEACYNKFIKEFGLNVNQKNTN